MLLALRKTNKMNRWLFYFVAGFVAPFIIVWMWVRHPIQCTKEAYRSWQLVFRGRDID